MLGLIPGDICKLPSVLVVSDGDQQHVGTRFTSLCLQSAERRKAMLSSLVTYLGPEAASFIHDEEKVVHVLLSDGTITFAFLPNLLLWPWSPPRILVL